jgi:hypothetical protein
MRVPHLGRCFWLLCKEVLLVLIYVCGGLRVCVQQPLAPLFGTKYDFSVVVEIGIGTSMLEEEKESFMWI